MGTRRRSPLQSPLRCARGWWAFVLLPRLGQTLPGRPGTTSSCPKSEWVDPETPSSVCVSQLDSAGRPLTLVFSDEFNVPGYDGSTMGRPSRVVSGWLQARLDAYQEADQRDFLADNSDQLATIISTKNQVIHDLQLQLQTALGGRENQPDPSQALAQALENAQTFAAEVERLRGQVQSCERKFRDQEHRLQLYREENHRQAGELAINAANSAAEIGRLQAQVDSLHDAANIVASRADTDAGIQEDMEKRQAQFEKLCQEKTRALEAREAAAAELEAMLKQQEAQGQQAAASIHALEDQQGRLSTRQAEFEQFCAERTKALEAREAAAAELEAKLKQQTDQSPPPSAKDRLGQPSPGETEWFGIRQEDVEKREAKFEQFCADVTKALEAREAAATELEAVLKQQEAQGQQATDDEMKALEDREVKLSEREAEFEQFCAERTQALEAREAAAAADAKVHNCFYEELEEQKQLLVERDQAALEQAALLEQREVEVEDLKSKLSLQQQELQKLEKNLRKREVACAEREQEAKQAASRARLEVQASRQEAEGTKKVPNGPGVAGAAGAIAASIWQDMEMGEHSGVTLTDLGLSQISGLPEADKFMQLLSALMAGALLLMDMIQFGQPSLAFHQRTTRKMPMMMGRDMPQQAMATCGYGFRIKRVSLTWSTAAVEREKPRRGHTPLPCSKVGTNFVSPAAWWRCLPNFLVDLTSQGSGQLFGC
eukprot:symbB.v1.2.030764.t2/scaffold3497.1/size55369/3